MKTLKARRAWLVILILVVNLGLGIFLFRRRKQRLKEKRVSVLRETQTPYGVMGLSEAEAAARQPEFDLQAEQRQEDWKFFFAAVRQSVLTIYNIDLFGIAVILYLLGNPLGAFGTLLLVLLNLVLNVFQQMYTKKYLDKILRYLRPRANVIRDGHLQSIDSTQIVPGDYLAVSKGDEFLVDGELLGGDSITVETLEGIQFTKRLGDLVAAGSYCLQGRTIYQANHAGFKQYKSASGHQLQLLLDKLTPFQKFMGTIFRALFGLVLIFGLLLLADALLTGANLVSTAYQDAFSIIFGIAPTSLFLILIITYAVGTLRIADRGALVYEATSIEEMASASYLCLSKESLVSGFQINLEPVKSTSSHEKLSKNLIQRMLGDFIHSMPNLTWADQMLEQSLRGEPRRMLDVVPLLFEQGWQAAIFDEPDLRGTFVLGLSELIDDRLKWDWGEIEQEANRLIANAQRNFGRWLKRFRPDELNTSNESEPQSISHPEKTFSRPALRDRFLDRLGQLLSPMEDQSYIDREASSKEGGIQLTFAFTPQLAPIRNKREEPQIPSKLIPLAHLQISERVHPEAGNSLQSLVDTGIRIIILSSTPPEESLPTALELGLSPDHLSMISGEDFDRFDEGYLASKIQDTALIGDLNPSHKAMVVNALQVQGEGVIMVGSNVTDVPALLRAKLRVALKNSSQAALRLTDIVLLKDSLAVLPHILITGQRLVNGILDVFKLYLSQTLAQLLLILFMLFFGMERFPLHPTQAGVVSAFAIAAPNIFLGVWATSGRVTGQVIRRQLAHFILPAALTTAFLAWGVYALFIVLVQDPKYAEVAVTYALLMAGWLRVLFVQPPSKFWVAAAPLRGDKRVIGVVIGSMLLFGAVISVPLFSELLRTPWLPHPSDYAWIALAVAIWAFLTRAIWRSHWWERLIDKI